MKDDVLRFYLKNKVSLFGVGEDDEKAEYIVFGVPFDSTTTFIPGCRFGPFAIRLFSENIDHPNIDEAYSKIADLGDLAPTLSVEWMLKRVYRVVKEIIGYRKKPIILGGEHTLTLGSIKAYAEYVKPMLLVFDAHLDLRSEFMDTRINHATWLRRLLEKRADEKVAIIGYRDFSREELEYAKKNIDLLISTQDVERDVDKELDRFNDLIESSEKVYVSIDLDVIGLENNVGVSNPSPNGLTLPQITNFFKKIPREKIVGLDVTEVNPLIDKGASASHAAYLISYILFHKQD